MARYLVTSALPYANGPIHFGHVVGAYLPADVYVRTLRMQGEEVLYVCGTDEHGVAITIGAEKEDRAYGEYVGHWRGVIKSTFDRLGIRFDVWSGTSVSPHHTELSQEFFRRLDVGGYLLQREEQQLYCVTDGRFLADRYIAGTCPNCGYQDARGDECPRCAKWLDPLDFVDPRCKVCGSRPEKRKTRHWYLDLPKLRDERLGAWAAEHEWKPNVATFVANQLKEVEPRPITRDMQWGVPVPEDRARGERGKVLYVWFDAPIGYVSFTREWADAQGSSWERWWRSPDTRLVHFIGKDNIPFHCVVFPAMLWGVKQDYVLPWQVPANEFYNLEGRKFSTSQGWYIDLDEFFARYDADAARYYLLASSPETKDSDFSWKDFQSANNVLLADTIGNLASRVLKFLEKYYDGRIPAASGEHAEQFDRVLLTECGEFADPGVAIRDFRFRRACEDLAANARVANVFVDRVAPWSLRKSDPERAGAALATCCEWLSVLARWMAPIVPGKAQRLWSMLGNPGEVAEQGWPQLPAAGAWRRNLAGQRLGSIEVLFPKIDDSAIAAELEALHRRAAEPA